MNMQKTGPAYEFPEITQETPVIKTETWRCAEIVFNSCKEYADPFADVRLDLILTGGDGQLIIPCFWDGGNVFKARVACPEAGTWYYRTVCSVISDTGLNGKTGVIECSRYAGEHSVYRHGFTTTRAGKKYFTYADGTPFFYLGDTHWSLGEETADMVGKIASKRVSQGYTVWQSEPIGAKFDLASGVTEEDMAGLRDFDEKFRIIADAGLTHANAEFFFPSGMSRLIEKHGGYSDEVLTEIVNGEKKTAYTLSDEAKEYLEVLSRFWVARYGAYPVMWTLGQEVDRDFYFGNDPRRQWNAVNNPYRLVAEYVAKYDAYSHPLTAHQEHFEVTSAYGSGSGRTKNRNIHISTSGCVISRYYFLCATEKFAIISPRPAENASLQNNEKRYTK